MIRKLKNIILSFGLMMLSVGAASAFPKITASIDSTVLEMGSRATITVNISGIESDGMVVGIPESGAETEFFDILNVDSTESTGSRQYRIKLQAFVPGEVTFEPFRYVVGQDTFESNHVSLKILPVDLDTLVTINPLETVVDIPPRNWMDSLYDFLRKYVPDYVWWIFLALILVDLSLLIYKLFKNRTLFVSLPKPVDPYEEAMAELNRLKDRRLAENGHEKEYYTALTDILRKYLERRFKINAMEMSTTQILDSLNSNPETRNNHPRIKQILDIADFVKFANFRTLPDDNIKTFNNVVQFVEDTKPQPEEKKESEESDIDEDNDDIDEFDN